MFHLHVTAESFRWLVFLLLRRHGLRCNDRLLPLSLQDLQVQLDQEVHGREELREQFALTERRSTLLNGEILELRSLLEQAEKARKQADTELNEAADRVNELRAQSTSALGAKKKLETDLAALNSDLDELTGELRAAEERAKGAAADATKLADELRQEQEHGLQVDKLRRQLEQANKELLQRVEEAEANALKGGKRIISKLEERVSYWRKARDTVV